MSSNRYADAKGRSLATPQAPREAQAPRPLTDAEAERVAFNRQQIIDHVPGAVSVIKDLHAAGLIDGWRAVIDVQILPEAQHGTAE